MCQAIHRAEITCPIDFTLFNQDITSAFCSRLTDAFMPPRTLASLAQSLSIAPDLTAALVALGEVLSEIDRSASVALLRYDG